MTKRLAYILTILLFAASLSSANAKRLPAGLYLNKLIHFNTGPVAYVPPAEPVDTLRVRSSIPPQSHMDVFDHKKIKEVAKPKHQPKPEKVTVPDTAATNKKANRQRRPEGVVRPPEIPRRN